MQEFPVLAAKDKSAARAAIAQLIGLARAPIAKGADQQVRCPILVDIARPRLGNNQREKKIVKRLTKSMENSTYLSLNRRSQSGDGNSESADL